MSEINNVALVCPASYDLQYDLVLTPGVAQLAVVAATLREGSQFVDPVVLSGRGPGADLATAKLLGEALASDGFTVLESPAIEQLNDDPHSWVGSIRRRIGAAVIGDPPIRPPIDHIGNVVAVVSPRTIAALTGLGDVKGISAEHAYFPILEAA